MVIALHSRECASHLGNLDIFLPQISLKFSYLLDTLVLGSHRSVFVLIYADAEVFDGFGGLLDLVLHSLNMIKLWRRNVLIKSRPQNLLLVVLQLRPTLCLHSFNLLYEGLLHFLQPHILVDKAIYIEVKFFG